MVAKRLNASAFLATVLTLATASVIGCNSSTNEVEDKAQSDVFEQRRGVPNPIFARSADELQKAIGKLTYLGPQKMPIGTVVFSTPSCKPTMAVFQTVQGGMIFDNDEGKIVEFTVSPSELRRILLSVQQFADKSVGHDDEHVSFAVARENAKTYDGYEFRIDSKTALAFYRAIRGALEPTNKEGQKAVRNQCSGATGTE